MIKTLGQVGIWLETALTWLLMGASVLAAVLSIWPLAVALLGVLMLLGLLEEMYVDHWSGISRPVFGGGDGDEV